MSLYKLEDVAPKVPADDQYWVAPDAAVIGNVELAPNVSIWFGTVLRGDNDPIIVGAGSNIQDQSVCHTDIGYPLIIAEGVTVGHRVTLHGCTIGAYSLIGMGSTILNGAEIGAECLIGAGALVLENAKIPPRSLVVGSPAKVVRTLSDEQVEGLRLSAQIYIDNSKKFRRGLHLVSS
ncbi:MAG: gamma carbonic anhydrase family protein [Gammaproteobacteria bacterium]